MPSNTRRMRIKKEKSTPRSWLDTVLQDPNSTPAIKRSSSSASSDDLRASLSNGSPVSSVSESEADVVAFLTDAALRRKHFEEERTHRKLPTLSKGDMDDLKHRMSPSEVGPLPNFGPQCPMLKKEEELLSLHKSSLEDSKPATARWILPSPPPTAKHSLEDSATPTGKWLLPSPPLTASKPTFATACQQQPSETPRITPPTALVAPIAPVAPAAPPTSNLRAIAPKEEKRKKQKVPLTIPTVGYEEMFKETPRLVEEADGSADDQMKKRGQMHVDARGPAEDE